MYPRLRGTFYSLHSIKTPSFQKPCNVGVNDTPEETQHPLSINAPIRENGECIVRTDLLEIRMVLRDRTMLARKTNCKKKFGFFLKKKFRLTRIWISMVMAFGGWRKKLFWHNLYQTRIHARI